jgi:hypothetical protein
MVMSFCYWMLRRLLELIVLRGRREGANEIELLRLLIVGRRHLERALQIYVEHYNTHRPHRSLDQCAPTSTVRIRRR